MATGTNAPFKLSEFCSSEIDQVSVQRVTHPEEHPCGDTGVTQCVPGYVSEGTLLDLRLGPPEFSEPEQLDDLLRTKEAENGERLRGEGSRVLVVQILHVGLGHHPIILSSKVDSDSQRGRTVQSEF